MAGGALSMIGGSDGKGKIEHHVAGGKERVAVIANGNGEGRPAGNFAGIAPEHRMAMLDQALADNLQFEVLDIEILRGGTSFAVDSVREIRRLYPDSEIFFIIGADTLPELHLWREIYTLLALCRFATFSRPGQDVLGFGEADLKLNDPWPARLLETVARGRMLEISSSDIRHRVAEGMSIRYLVPALVEMYITEHHLY